MQISNSRDFVDESGEKIFESKKAETESYFPFSQVAKQHERKHS